MKVSAAQSLPEPFEFQLRQIINSSSAIIYVKDPAGRYVLINRAFEKIFNCIASEVIGKDDSEMFTPAVAAHLKVNDQLVRDTAEAHQFEETLYIEGEAHTYLSSKFPLFTNSGDLYGVCGISKDITNRKLIEDALRGMALGVSAASSQDVFDSIVSHVLATLKVEYAFISRLVPEPDTRTSKNNSEKADETVGVGTTLETLALWNTAGKMENTTYQVAGSPCAEVFGQNFYMVPRDIQHRFPDDAMAVEMALESYAGFPLFSRAGKALGLIAIAHTSLLPDRQVIEPLLKIFAVRAAAELERLDAETSYREIFNACEDAIFVHDMTTGAILDVNPKACEIYGYSHAEFTSGSLQSLSAGFHPYTREEALKWITRASTDGPQRFEWRRRNRDGSLAWDEIQLRRATIGGTERILAFTRDITDRKHAEEALLRSERQHRAIITTALDCIISMDMNGNIIGFNPASELCFGVTQKDVMGKSLAELLLPPRYRESHYQSMKRYLATGKETFLGKRMEIMAMRANGEEFPAELAIAEVVQESGPLFIGYLRDITERQQAETERSRLEQELRQAQRLEAIGQLTGGIAHDFNNLLTSILGYTSMALTRAEKLDDEKLRNYLSHVHHAGDRARELIAQMLTFSRGGRGDPQLIQLSQFANEFDPLLRSLVSPEINVSIKVAPGIPALLMDPVQLEQVLINLSVNARDAMGGKGDLHIALQLASPNKVVCTSCLQCISGPHLAISVRDSGAGIKPEVLRRIFEPFFSSKEHGKGSGMGLSIVHGIVHECGGHIDVRTSEGEGTTFVIYLPSMISAGQSDEVDDSIDNALLPGRLSGRVVLVDDEPLVADFMHEQLTEWGLDVVTYLDPIVALKPLLASLATWDLVIIDQVMPGIKGLDLARKLLAERPDLSVILYTGFSDQLEEQHVLTCGIRALVRKPVDEHGLHQLVRQCLGQED